MSTRPLIPILALAVLLTACGTPRKACRKADRHMAKAVFLCPKVLNARTDTVLVKLPGDTITIAVPWSEGPVNTDTLLAQCDSLRAAAEALALLSLDQNEAVRAELQRAKALVRHVDGMRQQLCRVQDLHIERGDLTLHVWYDPVAHRLRASAKVRPRTIPCPNTTLQVNAGNATITGVSPFWRWLALLALGAAAVGWTGLAWATRAPRDPEDP